MLKKFFSVVLLLLLSITLISCKKEKDYSMYPSEAPDMVAKTDGTYDLNFITMHNFVIDYMTEEGMPFFYLKNGEFDISGDNESKVISVTCKYIQGTTLQDADLVLSMALNGIGINAAEQDYRFKAPTVGQDGAYVDFGTIFNVYELKIDAQIEDGTVLRKEDIKAGQQIPVDPKYIME